MWLRFSLVLLFLFAGIVLPAQVIAPVDSSVTPIAGIQPGQVRVDTLLPDSSVYIIRSISFAGNKITKQFILEREMTFRSGDTLTGSELRRRSARSRENLLNTALFNFVAIAPYCSFDSLDPLCTRTDIVVSVRERWYTWPTPIFDVAEQNFNTWWQHGHNLERATYGFYLWRYNFRGRKESIALVCSFGYARQFGAQYAIPYINLKQTLGLTFTTSYTQSHEVAYATRNNKLQFYRAQEGFVRRETGVGIQLAYRRGIYIRHTLDFKYTNTAIVDSVIQLASDYLASGLKKTEYFTLSYRVIRDHRDIKAYPLRGNFQEFEMAKLGFGILPYENLNVFYVVAGLRHYRRLWPRFFGAGMIRGRWMTTGTPPYSHQRAFGFSNYVRGYEYYVVDGQSYVLGKISFRYQLLKPHVYKIPKLKVEKFNTFHIAIYTGLFADAGFVRDRASNAADNNQLGNSLLFGYGAGIDIVTYYDLSLRVEYAFNAIGESGFFLHLGTPF
ncbi:MAG TPA: BamA/TamA family outer membrane protein [Bacteroidia bacterium]|nr:BamA/TamA family outer membrane protein [Bacteroidia bacterium]